MGVGCIFPPPFFDDKKKAKKVNFSMSICIVQVNIELLDNIIINIIYEKMKFYVTVLVKQLCHKLSSER